MPKPIKKRSLLVFSIFVSLILHALEIQVLQRQAFWFSTPDNTVKRVDSWTLAMDKNEKNQILKETFHVFSKGRKGSGFGSLCPIEHKGEFQLYPDHPDSLFGNLLEKEVDFKKNIHLTQLKKPKLELPGYSLSLAPLPKPELREKAPYESNVQLSPTPLINTLSLTEKLPRQHLSTNNLPPLKGVPPIHLDPLDLKFSHPSVERGFSLLRIPPLLERRTSSYSSFFETELVFLEEEEGSYLFALTLIPKENLELKPLKQTYCFLIDKANSIQKERLHSTKLAVKKAIEELNDEDSFNIVVFDQKLEKLFASAVKKTPESVEKAVSFLNGIELGSFFSQKNLYKPLFLTVPYSVGDSELHTAILITDAENLSNRAQAESLSQGWTRMNQGKVSLYTLGLSSDPQTETLEMIASLNRGKAIHSHSHKGMKRKLLKLMKSTSSPLAKNLSCQAISKDPEKNQEIELFPKGSVAPHLFLNEPYVILGKTNSLDDFVLFVQGRLPNEWLHIKKTISFSNAKKAPASLASQVAQNKSLALYRQYLEGAGHEFLVEANEISKSYDLPRVFE